MGNNRLNISFAWGTSKTRKGKFYNSVDFEVNANLLERDYQRDLENANIGKFYIGNSVFELTRGEIDLIMDTLYRAKDATEKKYKMGMLK